MTSFTLEELLIARMAREYLGEAIGIGATILSDLAARLAKATHAPDLFLTTQSRAAADPDVSAKALFDEWVLDRSAVMALGWQEMFDLIAQGRLQIWIGAVQIDRLGNSNISVLGPWAKPKVQLIGARGVPDDLWGCERLCYHVRRQTTRSFVPRVDFVCGLGNGPARQALGGQPARPGLVITDLGVFDFGSPDGGMRVVSLHPGVDFDTAQSRTGFPLHREAGVLDVTEPPTAAELSCIREVIDPRGLRRLESAEASDTMLLDLYRAELVRLPTVR
ncbi:MAG: CoA-transferase [Alphaproteobacteria bacterium]|nr:CoA-transferase [Alphaproteobacteria bacterium]